MVEKVNRNIRMTAGDTATIVFYTDTDYAFSENDRAIFAVREYVGEAARSRGELKIQKVMTPDSTGMVLMHLVNEDTEDMAPGRYDWDLRYVINPQYKDGEIIMDCDNVLTPMWPAQFWIVKNIAEV